MKLTSEYTDLLDAQVLFCHKITFCDAKSKWEWAIFVLDLMEFSIFPSACHWQKWLKCLYIFDGNGIVTTSLQATLFHKPIPHPSFTPTL